MTILDSYHQGQYSDKISFLIDQRILSRDGFELSADVVLPDESGPFPTVYLRTPYESSSQKSLERGVWWAKRGYAFVSGDDNTSSKYKKAQKQNTKIINYWENRNNIVKGIL